MVVESIAKENIENEKKESKEVAQKNAQILKELDKPLNAKDIKETKMVKDISKSQLKGLDKPLNAKNEVRQNVDTSNYSNKDIKNYDNSGNLYRVGDELIPNNTYEINGYIYKTDEQGRIVSAEGKLHLKEREGRLPIRDSIEDIGKGDEKEGDDRGHLIGDQFDGSNGLENMIPQDADINRNDFKNFENELAKAVKEGKEIYVKVEPIYDGESRRPIGVCVTYSINGEENVRIFPNGKE